MNLVSILLSMLKTTSVAKTYLPPIGLIALGVYYITSSDDPTYGVKVLLEGLAVLGIGHAVTVTPDATVKAMDTTPPPLPMPIKKE